jgi:hypothetical protein
MAVSAFFHFDSFVEALAEKKHNLATDVLKVLLTNVAPVAANAVKADITEISAGNGYTAGGNQAAQVSSVQTAGIYKLVLDDPAPWVATGGSIGPFRYQVLYNDTATNDELIGWWDYGSSITPAAGETFTHDLDPTTGVLTLAGV